MKRVTPSACRTLRLELLGHRKHASSSSKLDLRHRIQPLSTTASSHTHTPSPQPGHASNALQILESRGLVKSIAGGRDELLTRVGASRIAAYSGIDPTAASLHVGHLIPLNVLFWLYASGHSVVSLVGDGTAAIGDPTDRLKARAAVGEEVRSRNGRRIEAQLGKIWGHVDCILRARGAEGMRGRREIDSNARWLGQISLMGYLRTMGRCAKLGAMLSRDTVRNRLEKGESMTLAEFNYPLLQATDWFHLFAEKGVEVQIGGSDQYGNIVAGVEYINYMKRNHPDECTIGSAQLGSKDRTPFGITTPLLESSSGEKFGKSAGNAIWLDATMTTPFDLYGHLLRTADEDVERFLKLLTLAPQETIEHVMIEHREDPGKRKAQHLLAQEICRLAHGEQTTLATIDQHSRARGTTIDSLLGASPTSEDVKVSANKSGIDCAPKHYLPRSFVEHLDFANVVFSIGATSSVKEAKKLRQQGGLYAAAKSRDEPEKVEFKQVNADHQATDLLIDGQFLVIRSGKWRTFIVEVLDDNVFESQGLAVSSIPDWKHRVNAALDKRVANEAASATE